MTRVRGVRSAELLGRGEATTDRLVFNAIALRPRGGGGVSTYTTELLASVRAVTTRRIAAVVQRDAAVLLPPGVSPLQIPSCDGVQRALIGVAFAPQAALTHGLSVTLPLRARGCRIATVHDMSYFDVSPVSRSAQARLARQLWRRSIHSADAVISDSAFTAERVRALLGVDSTVVHLAPSRRYRPPGREAAEHIRRRYGLPAEFVLYVGSDDPRKGLGELADACRASDKPLVLAGCDGRGLGAATIKALGFVPSGDLPALYAASTVVAYPSHYEGFGLPPLEAMASGAPVVASRIPPHSELLGDAALYARPGDADALGMLLRDVFGDPALREGLIERGFRQSVKYSWQRTALETIDVYRRAGVTL